MPMFSEDMPLLRLFSLMSYYRAYKTEFLLTNKEEEGGEEAMRLLGLARVLEVCNVAVCITS